jgi:hypothetical protein
VRAPAGARTHTLTYAHTHTHIQARAHTHTHRHTHTPTHTYIQRSGLWGELPARDSASLRESARHAGACSSPAAASSRPEPGATSSSSVSARPGHLCRGRDFPPQLPRVPPPLVSPNSRPRLPGLERGCVVPGLLPGCTAGATSWDAALGVPDRGKFLRPHSDALHSAPHPVPSTATRGQTATLLHADPVAQQSFAPEPAAPRCGARVTCVRFPHRAGVAFASRPNIATCCFFAFCCVMGKGVCRKMRFLCGLRDELFIYLFIYLFIFVLNMQIVVSSRDAGGRNVSKHQMRLFTLIKKCLLSFPLPSHSL